MNDPYTTREREAVEFLRHRGFSVESAAEAGWTVLEDEPTHKIKYRADIDGNLVFQLETKNGAFEDDGSVSEALQSALARTIAPRTA